MKEVCKETRRPFTWYEMNGVYIRRDKHGKVNASIKGSDLPNPFEIAFRRREALAKGILKHGDRMDADPVTYKLWEHYYGKYDN